MEKRASRRPVALGRAYATERSSVAHLLAVSAKLRYLVSQARPSDPLADEPARRAWAQRVELSLDSLFRAALNTHSVQQRGELQAARDETVRQMAAAIPETVFGPLAQVHGWAELLLDYGTEDPELRYLCIQLYAATDRLVTALDRVRSVCRYVPKHDIRGGNILDIVEASRPQPVPDSSLELT